MIQVTYFQRKPRISSYSLEYVFQHLRDQLVGSVDSRVRVAPYFSNGIFRRLAIILDAKLHEGEINHVTGDINYACLLLRPQRTVLTILDCGDVATRRGVSAWLLRNLWFRWPAKRASVITTISEASRRDILRTVGCDPEKVVVIPVAVSDVFRPCNHAGVSQPPRVLQVGTSPNKNLPRVASALSGIDCTLAIVGELTTEQKACLEREKITYENYVGLTTEELYHQYTLCDVLVFVSLFEGFGMPIIEAQSVGRPVVTSNVTSMPEVAGNAACLVDPTSITSIRDGVSRVLNDKPYRETLVRRGFVNAKRFNSAEIANQYLAVYQSVRSQLNSNSKAALPAQSSVDTTFETPRT